MNNKYIFLDIDGVLATNKEYFSPLSKAFKNNDVVKELNIPYPFNKKCVNVFNEILDETNADIILSSDWRLHWSLKDLNRIFLFNEVKKSPISVTTKERVSISMSEKNRAYEIEKYVKTHNIENYVIIDDLDVASWFKPEKPNTIFLTEQNYGINKPNLKNKIIKSLTHNLE